MSPVFPWQSALIPVGIHSDTQSLHIPFVSQLVPSIHFCVHRTGQAHGTLQILDEYFIIKIFKDFSSNGDVTGSHDSIFAGNMPLETF